MKDDEWHSGPPPSVGWWPASVSRINGRYRWWDGKHWSCVAFRGDSRKEAAFMAARREVLTAEIEWKHWPERSSK